MRTFGVILAAGHGARMGAPKIFLRLAGDRMPLVARHVARFREAGCERIVVVTRPEHRASVDGAERVVAATCSQGCSLAAALAALPRARSGDRVLVTPIDVLPVPLATLERIARACDGHGAATPSHSRRGGHPALIERAAIDVHYTPVDCATDHRPAPPLRDVLATLDRVRVDVDDPNVTIDFDVPGDLAIHAVGQPIE